MFRVGVIFFAVVVLVSVCGTGLGAISTVSYQVSAGVDDGYAWSATEQDVGGIFLMVGDRWYSSPYFMSGMRFVGVGIPRSALIVSANLRINSGDDENGGHIYAVISGEAVDDANGFGSRYIADAVQGASSVDWDHKFAWSKNVWLESPDISGVVQEVVDRGGWSLGNSLALFYSTRVDSGKSRGFSSFEDGNSAIVEISYETYTISGHVTMTDGNGLLGVVVSAGSDIEGTVTDGSGYYELLVPPGWSGTVTVAKSDWGFNPSSRVYSSVSSDALSEDYSAIQPVISGYVSDGVGTGIDGVSVVSDNGGGSDTTDATGFYEIIVPYGWTGTVTPSKAGWGFNPESQIYNSVISDQTNQDYIAFQVNISGYFKDATGIAVEDVMVSADNGGNYDITDTNGFYKLTVPYSWSGNVTASQTDWTTEPSNRFYDTLNTSQIEQNFIIQSQIKTVSYNIKNSLDDGYTRGDMWLDYRMDEYNLWVGSGGSDGPPYIMSGMRFIDVNIPKGANIRSSFLNLWSVDDTSSNIYGTIAADDSDNAVDFMAYHMGYRDITTAQVNWDLIGPWEELNWHSSPDIASVVQEVINREGWQA